MTTKPKGVMIVGMEMPKNGMDCFLAEVKNTPNTTLTIHLLETGIKTVWTPEIYCVITKKYCDCEERPSWCPLQEVK